MAEFDLDIKIDDKMWENFSSHPSWKNPNRPTFQKNRDSNKNAGKSTESTDLPKKKTIEEVIQGSEPMGEKLFDLFQGNFKVDKDIKTNPHLLMDFEQKEGVKLILASPNFTKKDVEEYLNVKERLEKGESPEKIVKELTGVSPVPEATETYQEKSSEDLYENYVQKTSEEPLKIKETSDNGSKTPLKIEKDEKRSETQLQDTLDKTKFTPVSELNIDQKGIAKGSVAEKIIREESLKHISEKLPIKSQIVEYEKPWKRVKFDGQILANYLMRRIMFDSFHYVQVNDLKKEPNFLLNRFLQRNRFNEALIKSNREYGENYLFKIYFGQEILKSTYLMNRYFRNPILLKD